MNNNKPSTLILYATNPQKTLLHRLKRQTGMSEDDYRAMIYDASNGRTDSSKLLYKHEATQLIKRLIDPQGEFIIREILPHRKCAEKSRNHGRKPAFLFFCMIFAHICHNEERQK